MRAFYELKPNKILSFNYTLYPSYEIAINRNDQDFFTVPSWASSSNFYIYENSPTVQERRFFDVYGKPITGSSDPSGYVFYISSQTASGFTNPDIETHISATVRLKNLYASSSFVKAHNYSSASLTEGYNNDTFTTLNIPSILYGSEIKPGSFSIDSKSPSGGKVYDDGYGGLYFTSSTTDEVLVGCIMYQHGTCFFGGGFISKFTYPSPDFYAYTVYFSGTYNVPENIYLIDVPKGEANFSTNASYTAYDTGSAQLRLAITQPKTYPTTVGLYNEDYELLGVVKLATPLYHDEKTPSQIRAKLNF